MNNEERKEYNKNNYESNKSERINYYYLNGLRRNINTSIYKEIIFNNNHLYY